MPDEDTLMSLLTELFGAFSRYPHAAFVAQADRQVPLSLLEFAELPGRDHRRRADRIAQCLQDPNGRHSANSELYPPLHRLASGESPATAEVDLRLLELHLGLLDAGALSTFADGIYRLAATCGEVYGVRNGEVRAIAPRPFRELPGVSARVYDPTPGLYRDLLSAGEYPEYAPFPLEVELAKLQEAMRLLNAYSPELCSDFETLIASIALLPPSSSLLHTSLRLSYFRTVFVNTVAEGVNADVLVERLVHEYLHQRMRQWWFYEPVEGLPGDEATITSPFSGRVKPVPVMLQGLVIFIEALRYHLWALSRRDCPQDGLSAARVRKMHGTIPPLVAALSHHAPEGCAFAAQLRFLHEAYLQAAAPSGELLPACG